MQVLCVYGPRKSKPRLKSELRKQQYTVTLFDCNHFAHVIVLWLMQKFMCYRTVFSLFYFDSVGNFRVQAPGDFSGGLLRYEFWGGLYFEGFIHGGAYFRNLRYLMFAAFHNQSSTNCGCLE